MYHMIFGAADIEQQVISLSFRTVFIGAVVLATAAIIGMLAKKTLSKKHFSKLKFPLFAIMASAAVIVTAVLTYNTIHLNLTSESKGPVHWHADIEFWACGSEIELRDPTGFLSNKIGTSTYHEHNDKRIHLEGVVVEKSRDASLGKFMEVTGGYINKQGVGIPLNEDQSEWLTQGEKQDGDPQSGDFRRDIAQYVGSNEKGRVLELNNGSAACGDKDAELQVFVYRFNDKNDTYTQEKLSDPASYVIRDESVVPPGDCVIVEFDKPKNQTDKLCEQYGVRDSKRCTEFGVKEFTTELCNIRYEGVR